MGARAKSMPLSRTMAAQGLNTSATKYLIARPANRKAPFFKPGEVLFCFRDEIKDEIYPCYNLKEVQARLDVDADVPANRSIKTLEELQKNLFILGVLLVPGTIRAHGGYVMPLAFSTVVTSGDVLVDWVWEGSPCSGATFTGFRALWDQDKKEHMVIDGYTSGLTRKPLRTLFSAPKGKGLVDGEPMAVWPLGSANDVTGYDEGEMYEHSVARATDAGNGVNVGQVRMSVNTSRR